MTIIFTEDFEKDVKRLRKKYRSITGDIFALTESLKINPIQGTPMRRGTYKIRMSASAKGKGKSGGARVITLVLIEDDELYLVAIYDKSERANITDNELDNLIDGI